MRAQKMKRRKARRKHSRGRAQKKMRRKASCLRSYSAPTARIKKRRLRTDICAEDETAYWPRLFEKGMKSHCIICITHMCNRVLFRLAIRFFLLHCPCFDRQHCQRACKEGWKARAQFSHDYTVPPLCCVLTKCLPAITMRKLTPRQTNRP